MTGHVFSQVPRAEIPRSSFDRSHGHKTTLDAGYLYPVFLDEALPGDTFNLKMHAVARLATPIFPIMDNIYIDTQFFAVPKRLLWAKWEKFNGAQDNPADTTDYTIPVCVDFSPVAGSLADYFGLPIGVSVTGINHLPFRAYNLIWNEWYRDQNLQSSAYETVADGPDGMGVNYPLRKRGKRHDYFTSCLPWPQKGDAVNVPLTGSIPVVTTPTPHSSGAGEAIRFVRADGSVPPTTAATVFASSGQLTVGATPAGTPGTIGMYPSNLVADMTNVSSVTINTLRQAFQIQRILERDARGGTRYTELLKAHFGVTSPDARLQRPEYLGGFSQPINITQVHQTSGTAGAGGYTDTPLGQVGAIGTAVLDGNNHGFTWSATEHCYIIGLVSVRADMTYQQRLDRLWSRSTRFDFYWPALSHIGEQAVLNKEIYYQGNASEDNEVFGYQERYGEYRYKPSQVTGLFRSNNATPLDAWHLAYDFAAPPVLNDAFIQEDPPIDRVIAVPSEPHVILDAWFDLRCARPMPLYGVPGMLDHF